MVGDPKYIPHPVEFMGYLISFLKERVETVAGSSKEKLRIGGLFLTLSVVFLSGLCGWYIEQLHISNHLGQAKILTFMLLVFGLGSSLAAKSLKKSAEEILHILSDDANNKKLSKARIKLRNIVGRDVENLTKKEILRATAESTSENAVDGIFAPLFWMIVGTMSWRLSNVFPGPLAFAWMFKASSTIDSMIGYKFGKLRWLGETGARLDDIVTFIPCRLVVFSLPLISNNWIKAPSLIKNAFKEGARDLSPNSGLSEAIFAHCFQIKMGGVNSYRNQKSSKPLLCPGAPDANTKSINKIIDSYLKLEIFWIILIVLVNYIIYKITN